MTTRTNRWIIATALMALIVGAAASGLPSVAAWGAGLASSEWPMFHRDALHTGRADQAGPPTPGTRWWQGGAAVTGESGYTPHGPQGAIWSSAATSEVNADLGGAKKVWYFHDASWPTRATLVLRSEFPRADSTSVALNSAPGVVFETSAAMSFAAGSAAEYRNRDPYSNLIWLTLPNGNSQLRKRIPAGVWAFDIWVTDVSAPTVSVASATRSSNQVTITTGTNHPFVVGDTVRIDGVAFAGSTNFNATFVITGVPSLTQFTYAQAGVDDDTGTGGTAQRVPFLNLTCYNFPEGRPDVIIRQIASSPTGATRSGNMVTITTDDPHYFQVGDRVRVDGVAPQSFDGLFIITSVPGANTFKYQQAGADDTGGGGTVWEPMLGLGWDPATGDFDPINIPLPGVGSKPQLVTRAQPIANSINLGLTDGVAVGITVSGGSATMLVGGSTPSRVETSIEVPAIYAGSDDGAVYAFDAATGNVLWSYAVAGARFRSSPAVGDDGAVYIGSDGGEQGTLTPARTVAYRTSIGSGADEIPVVVVSGTPYEMGFSYGRLMAAEVSACMTGYLAAAQAADPARYSDANLDAAWAAVESHIKSRFIDELHGVADGAGISYDTLRRAHAVTLVSNYACSLVGVWGAASANGDLYQIRNLDYAKDAGLQDHPVIVVYLPETGTAHANVAFAGFVGSVAGMNAEGIALSEKGETPQADYPFNLDGIPFFVMFRDLLQDAASLDEALNIVSTDQRIKKYFYAIGDGGGPPAARAARKLRAFAPGLDIWTDNDPTDNLAPNVLPNVVYQTMNNAAAWNHFNANYGNYDPALMIALSRLVASAGGNLMNVVYDATTLEMWVAYAQGAADASTRAYVHFDLNDYLYVNRGPFYALNPNGTVKWIYPAVNQTLYFRSQYVAPDVPADFPADTALLYFGPGDGTDATTTVAQTGTIANGDFVRFVPRATNNVPDNPLPTGLTAGWLAEINPTATQRTMPAGSWTLDLALRSPFAGDPPTPVNTADAKGHICYRISKVTIGPGPSLVLSEELLGWTQDTQLLTLSHASAIATAARASDIVTIVTVAVHSFAVGDRVVVSGVTSAGGTDFNGTFVIASVPTSSTFTYAQAALADTGTGGIAFRTTFAHIQTPAIPERTWAQNEFVFVELAVSQVASAGAGGGWELLLEGKDGAESRLITAPLSEDPLDPISASPVVSPDDVVYIATHGGEVHAVDAESGQAQWVTALSEAGVADELRSSPAYDSATGTVYVGSMNGRLYALDGYNGEILWRYPASSEPALGAIESSPAIDEGRDHLYFGSDDGNIYCVQPVLIAANTIEPQLQWSFITGGPVTATPAVGSDGTIYVGSRDHNMYALTPDGVLAFGWPYAANGEIRSSAALATGAALFYFLNESVDEDPSRLRLSSALPGGVRPSAEIGLTFHNANPGEESLPPAKLDQEFRTRPRSLESRMPAVLGRGAYAMDFWARASVNSAQGEEGRISFKVFHATPSDATGRLILTFPEQAVTTNLAAAENSVQAQLATDEIMGADDYLRVEVWASATLQGGADGAVFFDFDGQLTSHLKTPVQMPDTPLVYFATSVSRAAGPPPQTMVVGRVYCLDNKGRPVWFDPIDGNPGYDPRAAVADRTAFTTSPALWQVESVWGTVADLSTFEFTNVTRTQEPVVFLGGQDSVMYALGRVLRAIRPPGEVPGQPIPQTVLRLLKMADRKVAYQDADGNIFITFTLRYRNESSVLADPVVSVQVLDPLPQAVDYLGQPATVQIVAVEGGDNLGSAARWTIGTVWPQDSGEVRFTVKVPNDLAAAPSNPQVEFSRTDPVPPGAVTDQLPTDFSWGQVLYIRLTGRGVPGKVTNSSATNPAGIYAGLVPMAYAAPVTVDVGWGDRYRLKFIYDELVPGNQDVTYATDIVLGASGTRTGRAEEAYQNPLVLGADETVFKVQLSPRGYAPGASAYAITAPPNRPWTPYYWKLWVEQMVGGSPGNEIWYTLRQASPDHAVGDADFQIHNPLSMEPAALYLTPSGAGVNPGTQTGGYTFSVRNTSLHPLTGSGSTTPRGVVRWGKVDLGHQGTAYPYYNPRDENYLPENAIHTEPDYLSLGPGQSRSVKVWGDVPAHLSPGVYRAPNAGPDTFDMPIYADLNGNDVWDRGEAKFEYEVGGVYYPFTIASVVSTQPLIRFGSQMMDLGKLPAGVNTGSAADRLLLGASGQLPQVPVRNLGNVDFRTGALGGITLGPASVAPPWGLPSVGLDVYKPPVGALRPSQGTVSTGGLPLQYDAPTGAYSGAGVAQNITTDPGAPIPNVVARDVSPFRVRAVERRLTGYESDGATVLAVLGADLEPWATWTDVNTLRLFWSSNTRADGAAPTPSDPYHIWHTTFRRSAGTWDPAQSYPAIGADPMDLPTSNWITKAHVTPGHAVDGGATRAEWLFWGGSDLRPGAGGGYAYDNRLLWTGVPTAAWPPTAADAIGDYPAVATGGQPVTDLFRLQPRPVFWTAGGVENNYVVLSQHSSSLPWQLALRYRSRDPANSWAGSPWLDGWVEKVEPVEIHIRPDQAPIRADAASGLVAARDPSVALDLRPDPATGLINGQLYQGYLWVAFSGVSGYHGNWDVYLARYDPNPVGGALTKMAFARVLGEPLSPDASRTVFASRHKAWQLSALLKIYVGGTDIGGTGVSGPDAEGWCVLQGTSLGNVDFHPGLGLVRFAGLVAGSVRLDYTPRLLRLTSAAANESNPALIVETYRYLDAGGNPAPAGYVPRLWVFWEQEGIATGAAEIMYETLRENAAVPGEWNPERAARRVPVDHAANEFGLSAVKDPAYPQVWLFWSSTRGAPTGQPAPPAAADSDLYYQAFAPELP